jgi:hypothetical protein
MSRSAISAKRSVAMMWSSSAGFEVGVEAADAGPRPGKVQPAAGRVHREGHQLVADVLLGRNLHADQPASRSGQVDPLPQPDRDQLRPPHGLDRVGPGKHGEPDGQRPGAALLGHAPPNVPGGYPATWVRLAILPE